MTSIRYVLAHPTLRFVALALLLLGAHNASLYPYQSVIAIERIGLTQGGFSWLLTLASAMAVVSSVLIGILGDQTGKRRLIALATALASTLGIGLMLLMPGKFALIAFHGVLLPIASSLYGQLFALARLASAEEEDRRRDANLGTLRSNLSLSFLAMLVFWTFAFGLGLSEMAVYVSGGIASAGLSLAIFFLWPRDGSLPKAGPDAGPASTLRLHEALMVILRAPVALRVLLLGLIASSGNVYMVLTSLIFDASPLRDASDVALYMGLVAGWEVPAMLIVPRLAARLSRPALAGIGTLIYAAHLIALPFWADTAWLWLGTFLAGVGGAIIITMPIPYYQDLMEGRPGTAGAMLAVQKLAADTTTALVFAFGMAAGGFVATALIGAVISLCGALGLWLLDRGVDLRRVVHG